MNSNVVKYQIISASDPSTVVQNVQKHIEAGWQPWGSLSTSEYDGKTRYSQAIVRYADENA